jgi:methylphosphotriester-DNA--protein-cysteine methyltransferase
MKFIKDLICKIFHIKACQCREEMDEHVEFFTKVPEPDVPVHVDPCPIHRYFKAKCHMCVAYANAQ